MDVTIDDLKVSALIYDAYTDEEYNLIFMDRVVGEFVGSVRTAFINELTHIAEDCYEDVLYPSEQANRINSYIYKTYHIKPDFPFGKNDTYGVYRNPNNKLWFGLIMDVKDNKLAPNIKGRVVINIKPDSSLFNDLLKIEGIYPGWHMNKKSWLSISLSDVFVDEFVESLIDSSYNNTLRKQKINKPH